jgi:hypothetical protein
MYNPAMDELNNIIAESAAAIEAKYFVLPIDGAASVYRERVFCYEFYHQMRSRWPDDCVFTLNGEVDKRSHPILRGTGVANTIPDFLIHVPGNMGGNHAIIEVKSNRPSIAAIRSDLHKITQFQQDVGYHRGIYLIFGELAADDVDRIEGQARRLGLQGNAEIWLHTAPNTAAFRA